MMSQLYDFTGHNTLRSGKEFKGHKGSQNEGMCFFLAVCTLLDDAGHFRLASKNTLGCFAFAGHKNQCIEPNIIDSSN